MAVGADAQVTDLTAGDHACLTFGEPEDLFDLTAAFVRDGLACGLKVVWVSDSAPQRATAELARRGVAVESALAGQRVAVDLRWALRAVSGVEQLPDFVEGVAAALAGTTVSVLCQYDREGFDPVTLATVSASHTRSVAAATYYADAVLRICRQYAPPGIRLAGEIDYQHAEHLALALTEAIRLEGDITVNMTALAFIDGSCARMIVDAARGLAPSRTVALHCHPGIAATFEVLGAGDMAGVSLVGVL